MNNTKNKNNGYVYLLSAIVAMGGLMFGFDTAVISGAEKFIQDFFGLTNFGIGFAVSSLLIGCLIGASFAGKLSDTYGRRTILIWVALFFAVSCFLTAVTSNIVVFIAARIFGGIAVGAASILSPLYIAEIAPYQLRGKLVSLFQLSITMGILVSYFINYSLHDIGENNWRWMLASGVFPSILFFVGLFVVPESPRWLYLKGKQKLASDILIRIGGADNANKELEQIKAAPVEDKKVKIVEMFRGKYKKIIWVGFILALLVQFTGINTIIYYAPRIFESAGNTGTSAFAQTVFIGVINFLFTFVAIFSVDKFGRKPLYVAGSLGMTVSLLILAIAFYFDFADGIIGLIPILLFIASFAACIGPVFWVLMSEIFPGKIRGTMMSIAVFAVWGANVIVTFFFPWVLENTGGGTTFAILTGISLFMLIYTLKRVPETKGKTLEEIEKQWD